MEREEGSRPSRERKKEGREEGKAKRKERRKQGKKEERSQHLSFKKINILQPSLTVSRTLVF